MNWKLIEDKSWCSLEQLFEWVREMNTVQQDIRYHAEGSVAEHTRMVLEALQQSSAYHSLSTLEKEIIWTSALLHDVEKRSTSVDEGEGRVSAKGHARKGEYTVRTILYRDCPAPFHIREQIASLVRYHGLPVWLMEKPDSVKKLCEASFWADYTTLTSKCFRRQIYGFSIILSSHSSKLFLEMRYFVPTWIHRNSFLFNNSYTVGLLIPRISCSSLTV